MVVCCVYLVIDWFSVFVMKLQAEGPKADEEEESEKSMSEVNDEEDDDEGSGEVGLHT